ncbi:hypothetical protein [Teredinibacter haidensis]|nr:hypothetical protein [Teredinibacter haidensis]
MKKTKSSPKNIQELKKEKSKTNWGRVLAEKESSNKAMQPTQKTRG